MIVKMFIVIALLTLWCEYKTYKKLELKTQRAKVVAMTIFVTLQLLPLVGIGIVTLIPSGDLAIVRFISWVLTVYLIATATICSFGLFFITIKSRKVATVVGCIAATAAFSILLNGLVNTRTNLIVKRVEVNHENLPQSFDSYKIVFFSDLHIGSLLNPDKQTKQLVKAINAIQGDMVIFGGDLTHINHSELTPTIIKNLSQIEAHDGIYTVLGNHDTGVYVRDTIALTKDKNIELLCSKIGQMGWTVLQDSTIYAHRGCDSIAVTGIDFTEQLLKYKHSFVTPNDYSPEGLFALLPDSLFNIVVSHLPQLWQPITDGNYAELTLSGHIHAMQISADCFGYRLSPAMLMYKRWSGLYQQNGNHLYINDGVGCVGFYMRIGARPEITVIELKR